MHNLSQESFQAEEARIQAVYARRQDGTRYSWFNPGHLFLMQDVERRLLDLLSHYGCAQLETKKILEIGCGAGHWIREFIKWGARPENVVGVDLLSSAIVEAKRLCPAAVTLRCGSATELVFPPAVFDLVHQSTVFTSVRDRAVKRQIASEMIRVLKPDGLILWYDYHANNPWNPDVRGVKKREIYQLFPGCRFRLDRVTLIPPLARLLAPHSWLTCSLLEKIPWLRTHYIGVIRKRPDH